MTSFYRSAKELRLKFKVCKNIDFKNTYLEQFPIGSYLYNNLVHYTKTVKVDLNDEAILDLAEQIYSIGVQSYLYSKKAIEDFEPDVIYLCNGRFMSQAGTNGPHEMSV